MWKKGGGKGLTVFYSCENVSFSWLIGPPVNSRSVNREITLMVHKRGFQTRGSYFRPIKKAGRHSSLLRELITEENFQGISFGEWEL